MFNTIQSILFKFRTKKKFKRCESFISFFSVRITGGERIEIGKKVYVGTGSWLATQGGALVVNDYASIGRNAHIYSTNCITIEESSLIAEKVYISDNLHGYKDITIPIKDQPLVQCAAVRIGEGCWIGENVCVIGASIGKHSVVGANSVVIHDIPDYCVAVGAPAKVIKKFDFEKQEWISIK